MSRGEIERMSRYKYLHTSTFSRAGFYLPVSGARVYPDMENSGYESGDYDYIPVIAEKQIDDFNIIELYEKIRPKAPACLLESLSGDDNNRYSIIAAQSLGEVSTRLDNSKGVELLRDFLGAIRVPSLDFPFFYGGLLGYWSYETGMRFHDLTCLPANIPEQYFFMPGEIIAYDRCTHMLTIIVWVETNKVNEKEINSLYKRLDSLFIESGSCCNREEPLSTGIIYDSNLEKDFTSNIDQEGFRGMVLKAQEHIRKGDIFQVVLSRRWKKKSRANPWRVYQNLRRVNPSPYMFYLNLPDSILLGASPEMLVKVDSNKVKTRPIAGTRRIYGCSEIDRQQREELLADEKEKAEHLMLVDLSRNDIGKVSIPGSVEVGEFFKLETYSHVVHIVSTVKGQLIPEADALDALTACFPAGTLTGAPKRRAMQIIAELEGSVRGSYGGAVGYVTFGGDLDSCITIRALLYKQGWYYLQSGAGIVADSSPDKEYEETFHKARVLMEAVKEAEVLADDSYDR